MPAATVFHRRRDRPGIKLMSHMSAYTACNAALAALRTINSVTSRRQPRLVVWIQLDGCNVDIYSAAVPFIIRIAGKLKWRNVASTLRHYIMIPKTYDVATRYFHVFQKAYLQCYTRREFPSKSAKQRSCIITSNFKYFANFRGAGNQ